MKRRLFLTGPIGCGKSTAIATALGEDIVRCGGFLTRRYREPYLHFCLETPDGCHKETFLDFSSGKPILNLEIFSSLGTDALRGDVLILDEIGGIELLVPEFVSAFEEILGSDIPILGVIKGEGPASALINTLGLTAQYEAAVSRLREMLKRDTDTLLYECSQYDKKALFLAGQWAEEYLHG